MAGQSRAAQRREKQKQKQPQTASTGKPQQQKPQQQKSKSSAASAHSQPRSKPAAYDSDSDSDDEQFGDAALAGVIPLKSLEDAAVRDFVSELEQTAAAAAASSNTTKTSKRTRAELAQHAIDSRKKRYREDKAQKIVWRKFDRENRTFEQYYQSLLQLSPAEWHRFIASLQAPMPVHVRVNGNYKSLAEIVTGTLETDFDVRDRVVKLATGEEHSVTFAPVPWTDDTNAIWKLTLDSKSLRKADSLADLSSYFQAQCHVGTLLRQEPATSIVAAFLNVQPGDRVLDLCGGGEHRAPMLVEALATDSVSSMDSALLVVNERDASAASAATRSLSRTLALARQVVVTAHKPLEFPEPLLVSSDTYLDASLFDRVVCAAPCSGDGLIRKLPERWRTWSPAAALKSHASQVALALKAIGLTRAGGSLVYCTRSFNPIENEAVVAELLRSGAGAYELVDVADVLPTLERSAGLTTWDVLDVAMARVATWDDATDDQKRLLRPTMWPPTLTEQPTMHLARCQRFLPHQNDTHGLFVAVIRKTRHVAAVLAGPAAPSTVKTKTSSLKTKTKANAKRFVGGYAAIDARHLAAIRTAYGLASRLTTWHFVERSGVSKDRSVHFVTPAVTTLLDGVDYKGRLAVYRAGVEALRRVAASTATNSYELIDDGARALLPFVSSRRVLSLQMSEFAALLTTRETWLQHASDAVRTVLADMTEGSLVVVLDDMEPAQTADRDIALVATKRHSSYSLAASSAAVARVKTLLAELNTGDGDDDGYDSFEYED